MDIAIIGAGNVGTALATAFARAGHTSPSRRATPRMPAPSPRRPVRRSPPRTPKPSPAADVVVLAIPVRQRRRCRGGVGEAAAGKAVVDVPTGSRSAPTARRSTRPPRTPRSSRRCFPDAHVVKAFNTLFASARPTRSSTASRSTASSPATTPPPRQTVLELVESIGLRPGRCRAARAAPASSRAWPS